MRLTSLRLEDFRRFEDLKLDPIDPGLTVVVGPNGEGKSTLFQALAMVDLMLTWSSLMDASSDAYNSLQVYAAATRHGSKTKRFRVRVGIELTEDWEWNLLVAFIKATVVSTVLERNPPEDASVLDQLVSTITRESVMPLAKGTMVGAYLASPSPTWLLGYEFESGGRTYHASLQGGPSGQLFLGPMPMQQSTGWQSADLPSKLVALMGQSAPFTLEVLLPEGAQAVPIQVKGNAGHRSPIVGDFVTMVGGTSNAGRDYYFGPVLNQIVKRSLALISDQRLPARTEYGVTELGLRPGLVNGADVPLELYRLKNGGVGERQRYREVQKLFHALSGKRTELRVRQLDQAGQNFAIEPTVAEKGGWEVPVTLAGAGIWEALILATVLVGEPGMVAMLDEPAVNLGPTLQRRLSDQLVERAGTQVLLITHSPYLVPIRQVDDLRRIARLASDGSGGSRVRRLVSDVGSKGVAEGFGAQLRQLLAGRADVRSALFAAGVVLVEGETETGALDQWFTKAKRAGKDLPSPESSNLLLLSVGGDGLFGPYAAYLHTCGIPWVVLADGPVLSPKYANGTALLEQLRSFGLIEANEPTPALDASFNDWAQFWRQHRVHTLAITFGGIEKESKDKSGEIEALFERVNPHRWAEAQAMYHKSKIRQGHHFASSVECPEEVTAVYQRILTDLARRRR